MDALTPGRLRTEFSAPTGSAEVRTHDGMSHASAGQALFLAFVVFVGGVVAAGANSLACAEYDPTVHSLRTSICPVVAGEASWPTFAVVPPFVIFVARLAVRSRRALTAITVALACLELAALGLAISAGSSTRRER